MFRRISNYLIMGLLPVFTLLLIGCGSESGGTPESEKLVQQTFSENCSLCHDSGSVADLDIVHSIATNSPAAEISGVTVVGGTVTVSFNIYDSENPLIPIASVSGSSIRLTLAKLDATGNWQSYINSTETKAG